jgi:hypothetical protein
MVQAILEGRKTQTRRIIKGDFDVWNKGSDKPYVTKKDNHGFEIDYHCPKGKPGDVLWVRETFMKSPNYGIEPYYYKASVSEQFLEECTDPWKPSIYMPKTAARIWLEITDVRVERLQNISNENAIAEGIEKIGKHRFKNYLNDLNKDYFYSPIDSFRSLFESIVGEQSWKAGPWVWAISFKCINNPNSQ